MGFPLQGSRPQVDFVRVARVSGVLDRDDLIRRDPLHVEVVRDDPRARLELLQLRNELGVQARQEIQRHHVGVAQVQREDVLVLDGHQVADAVGVDVPTRLGDAPRVDVVADGLAAVLLRGGDGNPAVAATQVVQQVPLGHLGQLQHLLDHVGRRGHKDDIGLAQRLGRPCRRDQTHRHHKSTDSRHLPCHDLPLSKKRLSTPRANTEATNTQSTGPISYCTTPRKGIPPDRIREGGDPPIFLYCR